MAHQWVRCNLASAVFPFETQLADRTILVPQYDQNYDYLSQIGQPVKNKGIPQAFYMHNCMPTPQGYQSIGYDTAVNAMAGSPGDFTQAVPLEYNGDSDARVLMSPAAGKNYIYDQTVGAWESVDPVADFPQNGLITSAYVQGTTFIFYEGVGAFQYNTTTKAMDVVNFSGLAISNIKGVCSANGYNIVWNNSALAWSNTVDPTDFTPSLATGAGGGSVPYIKGNINFCVPISGGFLIYCDRNIVSATYSGNINFPYIYKEVAGSGGAQTPEQVSFQANLAQHYAWTTAGLQTITVNQAEILFPEVTDFLASLTFEDFNETTLILEQTYLAGPLSVIITAVANRFIVVSYGIVPGNYTHALVYDDALKRWGKLKIDHRDCFEWNAPNVYGPVTYGALINTTYGALASTTYGDLGTNGVASVEIPKKNLAFLQQDGTVKIVNFDLRQANADGVLILGKFQFERNKFIIHQTSDIENVINGNAFSFYIIPTLDGKTLLTPVKMSDPPNLLVDGPLSKRCGGILNAQNVSALFIGAFNLVTYLINFTMGGDR